MTILKSFKNNKCSIDRFIFEDCWYAPIEKYTSQNNWKILNKFKVKSFKKLKVT